MTSVLSVIILLAAVFYETVVAPPVTKNKENAEEGPPSDGLENYMEYHRYLREVVSALESDPEFKRKLEKADEADIRSGKIADELDLVSHHIRNRLDEIKRAELVRLRDLTKKKQELENNSIDDPVHHHLDQHNEHTFEIEDLRKLIFKTTQDLAEADRRRREEFKQYELQKEYDKQQKLNHTQGEDRDKLEQQYKEMEEKHKTHEKLHEPGHKQQLEEVWEKQDHMQQNFDPKTFFMLHDLDGNGLWDETEVKALFIKELDKMYAASAPEDDMRERAEEMERMRETVFAEVDTNQDGFIDYNEFIAQTKRNDYQQDHGWKGLDEQQAPYTDEELQEYIRIHEAQQRGQFNQMPPPGMGYPGQVPPGYQQPGGYQVPQGGYQVPPGGYQVPPGGYQVPPGGYQVPPGGYQVPPGAYHPNDIYGNPHDQVAPSPNQLHPGQLPQAQVNPQQMYHQKVPHSQGGVPVNQEPNQPNVQSNPPNQPNVQSNPQNVPYNPPNQPNVQSNPQNVPYNPPIQPNVQPSPQQNVPYNPPNQPNVQPSPQQIQQNVPNPASSNAGQNKQNINVPASNDPNNLNQAQNVPQVQKT